jgi:hypothetical protein
MRPRRATGRKGIGRKEGLIFPAGGAMKAMLRRNIWVGP